MLNANLLHETQINIDGMWVAARPIKEGFWQRIKDAIEVIKGRADAVKFYKQ